MKLFSIYLKSSDRKKAKLIKFNEKLKLKQFEMDIIDRQLELYNELQLKKLKELEEKANQIKNEMSDL